MRSVNIKLQTGQVGLVTLLIMSVILIVAISLSQRTIQQQDEAFLANESTRVFNAAESGVEDALSAINSAEEQDKPIETEGAFALGDDQVSYRIDSSQIFEMNVMKNNVVELPVNLSMIRPITISWGYQHSGNCADNPSAIVVSLIGEDEARYYGFDPCADTRQTNFNEDSITPGADSFRYQLTLGIDELSNNDLILRIKPLFAHTRLRVSSDAISLAQYNIESTGLNTSQELARTLELKRSLPGSYSFMDYTLVSGSNITKN